MIPPIRVVLAAVLVIAGIGSTACGFNPSNYVMPGTGVTGPTYRLSIEFSSVLSLPAGAQVRSNGAEVGSLRSIELTAEAAVAHVEIRSPVRLPPRYARRAAADDGAR